MKQYLATAFVIFYFIVPVQISAQDTLVRKLDSLEIISARTPGIAQNRKYSAGTHITSLKPSSSLQQQAASLAEFIKSESALYLKESGKGAGSYLSVRGTSSSHTKITWNDIDISFPTMGVADFTLIPVYFIDGLDIHTGAGSAAGGEGSIGGALRLSSSPKWEEGVHGNVLLAAGSYNTLFTGATVRYSHNGFETRSSLYGESATNNYTFRNNTIAGYPWERLNNASTGGYGALQEFGKRFSGNTLLNLSLMALRHDREIQPTVSNNTNPNTYASINDEVFRIIARLYFRTGRVSHLLNGNWSHDRQEYKSDIIAAGRVSGRYEAEYSVNIFSVKGGVSAEFTNPEVYSYDPGTKESRASVYALLRYSPAERLTLSGGVRAMWVTDIDVPVMPSIDIKYNAINGVKNNLSLRASLSRSVKVPTLNDRYWGGNNLYLKPETALTTEVGADYTLFLEAIKADLWVTFYRSSVNDWIRWLPAGSVWRPQNIPEVLSRGVESGLKIRKKIAGWENNLSLSYNYTNIKMMESLINEDPAIGNQLAYQPRHNFTLNLSTTKRGVTLFSTMRYTGERTTVDIFDIMPSYAIFDAGATYQFRLAGYKWNASAKIMNLSDKQYQNVKFYAMPGINYRVSLQWNF